MKTKAESEPSKSFDIAMNSFHALNKNFANKVAVAQVIFNYTIALSKLSYSVQKGICLYMRGTLYLKMDELNQAKRDFKHALEEYDLVLENESDPAIRGEIQIYQEDTYVTLASIYERSGELKLALDYHLEAFNVDPNYQIYEKTKNLIAEIYQNNPDSFQELKDYIPTRLFNKLSEHLRIVANIHHEHLRVIRIQKQIDKLQKADPLGIPPPDHLASPPPQAHKPSYGMFGKSPLATQKLKLLKELEGEMQNLLEKITKINKNELSSAYLDELHTNYFELKKLINTMLGNKDNRYHAESRRTFVKTVMDLMRTHYNLHMVKQNPRYIELDNEYLELTNICNAAAAAQRDDLLFPEKSPTPTTPSKEDWFDACFSKLEAIDKSINKDDKFKQIQDLFKFYQKVRKRHEVYEDTSFTPEKHIKFLTSFIKKIEVNCPKEASLLHNLTEELNFEKKRIEINDHQKERLSSKEALPPPGWKP